MTIHEFLDFHYDSDADRLALAVMSGRLQDAKTILSQNPSVARTGNPEGDLYVDLVRTLLEAGSSLHYPDDPESDSYYQRMLTDASPQVKEILLKIEDRSQETEDRS